MKRAGTIGLALIPLLVLSAVAQRPESMGLVIGLSFAGGATAQEVFVDEGVCPGEGCRYGERWVARTAVELRESPDPKAPVTGTLKEGEPVQTIDGEVHTAPVRFIVHRAHEEFAPGDEVLVYTYLGEGRFRLRHNGTLKDVDLDFSPAGSSNGTRCEVQPRCWGTLEKEHQSQWWIKVRTASRLEGWVLGAAAFQTPGTH